MIEQKAQQIISEVAQVFAAKYGTNVGKIKIIENGRLNRVWGRAEASKIQGIRQIHLATKVFAGKENTKAFRNTVIHEFAHIAEYELTGVMDNHGILWQQIMRNLGEIPNKMVTTEEKIETEYTYVKRKMTMYAHRCACRNHIVGGIVHNKILRGLKYRCKECGCVLQPEFYETK